MLYKFTGAGNNFVVLDGRGRDMAPYRAVDRIQALCRQYSTDGLMILGLDPEVDFSMEFYNPDGTGGMMCGNGGRCIVAFADMLGLKPVASDGTWLFRAPDGLHIATILQTPEDTTSSGTPFASLSPAPPTADAAGPSPYPCPGVDMSAEGSILRKWTVRLKMIDVQGIEAMMGGYFLNTGTRHFVKFVADVNAMDMERDAKPLRWDKAFQPVGTNVNFVQVATDGLHVRTFEKGVEGETLACGTGLTASALAAYGHGIPGQAGDDEERHGRPLDEERHGRLRSAISYRLQCRRGDWLQVEFHPAPGDHFTDVYLTGPAECLEVIE